MFLRFTICHSMHQNFILFYDWIISIMWIYQIRLSSQQLMDIWVVFTFCPLWIVLQWIWVHMNLCEHQFLFFWVDTQEWNYCVIRKSTFTIFSFLLNLLEGLNCFPFGKGYHFISPPAVYESYSLYTCSTTLLLSNTFSFDYTYFREC